jgi:hypothetical protein
MVVVMREVRAIALALLALLGAVSVVGSAPAAGPTRTATVGSSGGAGVTAVEASTGNNSSMGSEVSSFMQSTTGETGEEVEAGMWNAAYENSSNRTAVVDRRADSIGSRLDELHRQKRTLVEAYRNGSINRTEYQARMSYIVGRMAGLNRSIEETARQANETGADVTAVGQLRTKARNLTGQEIAAVARSLAGGPPANLTTGRNDTGPPAKAGPPNGTQGPSNATGPPDGSKGPRDDDQTSQGNETGDGPSDDGRGQGNAGGQGNDEGQGTNDVSVDSYGIVHSSAPVRSS